MLLFTAFSDKDTCSDKNYIGHFTLYEKSQTTASYEGIIVVCVDVDGNAEEAEILIEKGSTLDDGAAAAACRQKGYVASDVPISGSR